MGEPCARIEVEQSDAPGGKGVIYVKSRWFSTRFSLLVSDGLDAWSCEALEEEVSRKADSWDCTVAQYLEEAEKYLGVQDPTSNYTFNPLADGARKLSWTLVKDGVPLVANWRVEKSHDPIKITRDILDCLMRGSSRISEELQRKKRSFEQMKVEAERAVAQSQRFMEQKIQFEIDIYSKFVAILNSKKNKLRELRELLLELRPAEEASKGKNEMVVEAESEDELNDTDGEDDHGSEEKASDEGGVQLTKKGGDEGSDEATDILPADSPEAEDVSTKDPPGLQPHSVSHGTDRMKQKIGPATQTSKRPTETITDASTLLSGSTYTSAPRKRKHL